MEHRKELTQIKSQQHGALFFQSKEQKKQFWLDLDGISANNEAVICWSFHNSHAPHRCAKIRDGMIACISCISRLRSFSYEGIPPDRSKCASMFLYSASEGCGVLFGADCIDYWLWELLSVCLILTQGTGQLLLEYNRFLAKCPENLLLQPKV